MDKYEGIIHPWYKMVIQTAIEKCFIQDKYIHPQMKNNFYLGKMSCAIFFLLFLQTINSNTLQSNNAANSTFANMPQGMFFMLKIKYSLTLVQDINSQ